MHKNFGEWYRLVSIEPNGELLEKRWAAVEDWASTLQNNDTSLLETVRIFRGMTGKTSRETFLEVFRKHDPAFPQRNQLELQVLAGASLVALVDDGEDESVRAAIIAGTAVAASSLHTTESDLREVTEEILAHLQRIARDQRRRKVFSTSLLGSKPDAVTKGIEQVAAAGDWDQLKTHVGPVLKTLLIAVRRSEIALEAAAHSLHCADEETNILWWLEGRSSRDLNTSWASLPKESVPLIAAKELADLTDIALGPQDAAALLHRVVSESKCKKVSVQAYVNAVPEEWCKKVASQDGQSGLDLAPLWFALHHRSKSDRANWAPFFESTLGLSSTTLLLEPERVAQQAYFEAVLLKTLADVED